MDASKAQEHMNGGQLDGNVIKVQFVLIPRSREPVRSRVQERDLNQDG